LGLIGKNFVGEYLTAIDLATNLYSMFLAELRTIALSTPKREADIIKHFSIEPVQARKWRKQAEGDGKVAKKVIKGGEPAWIWKSGES